MSNQPTIQAAVNSAKFPIFLEEGLTSFDSAIPTEINAGGCGYFAQMLSEELAKFAIPFKIFCCSDDVDEKEMQSYLNDMTIKNNNIDHIIVCVNNIVYCDSTGIVNIQFLKFNYKVEISKETLDEMLRIGETKDTWNPIFDRDCLPQMHTKLDEVFSHLADFHPGMFQYVSDIRLTEKTIENKRKRMPFGMSSIFSQILS